MDHDPAREQRRGAPNFFNLRHAIQASPGRAPVERRTRSLVLATGIAVLALALVGLRFYTQSPSALASGLQALAIDSREQPVVLIGGRLYWHNRAGIGAGVVDSAKLGPGQLLGMDFFDNGELLILQGPAAPRKTGIATQLPDNVPRAGNTLRRCERVGSCVNLVNGLGAVGFLVERRSNSIFLAKADEDRLEKLDSNGKLLVAATMELNAPLHLQFEGGILYLTQAQSDAVTVLKPDERDFGRRLEDIPLPAQAADNGKHVFPGALLYHQQRWWTTMQSVDGGSVGLYLFSPDWRIERSVALPGAARPISLNRWRSSILVVDSATSRIYRYDSTATREADFSPEYLDTVLAGQRAEVSLSRSLRTAILVLLCSLAAGLFTLTYLQIMHDRVYTAPASGSELDLDISSEKIQWLALDANTDWRRLGLFLSGAAGAALAGCWLLGFGAWVTLAISLLLAGAGGLYLALQQGCRGHLGALDNRLIVVDHSNTYRVGIGPEIQYFQNFVMINDVVVYLGNRLLARFCSAGLQERFQPLLRTGIKVDRATLGIRLIQQRHPLALGGAGVLAAVAGVVLLALYGHCSQQLPAILGE